MSEEIKFLSVAEAADRLGVTRTRVNQLINDGTLKAQRVGRSFAIDVRDLGAAEARNTKKTGRPRAKKNSV
jgi:excisionase family DNA binding protein